MLYKTLKEYFYQFDGNDFFNNTKCLKLNKLKFVSVTPLKGDGRKPYSIKCSQRFLSKMAPKYRE